MGVRLHPDDSLHSKDDARDAEFRETIVESVRWILTDTGIVYTMFKAIG